MGLTKYLDLKTNSKEVILFPDTAPLSTWARPLRYEHNYPMRGLHSDYWPITGARVSQPPLPGLQPWRGERGQREVGRGDWLPLSEEQCAQHVQTQRWVMSSDWQRRPMDASSLQPNWSWGGDVELMPAAASGGISQKWQALETPESSGFVENIR